MEPFIGQIQPFGFNFAPRGWAKCDGQILPINQNTALFSLLGTTYGGDGRTSFGLPDLRGRAMLHEGHGPGLSDRTLGEKGGSETNTMNITHLPSHTHGVTMPVTTDDATSEEPNGRVLALASANAFADTPGNGEFYRAFDTVSTGNGQPINNMQPFLVINVCIALQGVFPSRS